MSRRAYPTDLSDAEYACLEPHLPVPSQPGRPRVHPRREILDAIFHAIRGGCAWRLLPHEFPPWQTVYHSFRLWRLDGTWERLNAALRERLRERAGRTPQPSAGIVDSQSVKTTGVGGERGYDGAKKLSGRKRHLLVDTQGLVLRAKVHSAALRDRAGVPLLLEKIEAPFPRLEHVWVDQGDTGSRKDWIEGELGWTVEVVQHPPKPRGEWVPLGTGSDPRPFEWRRLPPERTGFRGCCHGGGWWSEPSHTAQEAQESTDGGRAAIIGTAGLLRLVEAVERLRAPTSHGEGKGPSHVRPIHHHRSPRLTRGMGSFAGRTCHRPGARGCSRS